MHCDDEVVVECEVIELADEEDVMALLVERDLVLLDTYEETDLNEDIIVAVMALHNIMVVSDEA